MLRVLRVVRVFAIVQAAPYTAAEALLSWLEGLTDEEAPRLLEEAMRNREDTKSAKHAKHTITIRESPAREIRGTEMTCFACFALFVSSRLCGRLKALRG